jgi:uncharacterized membrane protein YfcA
MCIKAFLQLRGYKRDRELIAAGHIPPPPKPLVVRPIPTILVGALGGLVVGMTSVGSGSLIIVTLLLLYPSLKANQLVGTDLVQAVPLVGAAALGHILYGDFQLALTTSLLIGSIPGCYLGAKVSSSAPQGLIRRALVLVLVASGLKLFNVSNADLGLTLLAGAILGPITWAAIRHFNGFTWRYRPALPETEQNPSEATAA